jgi:hypothetical protein
MIIDPKMTRLLRATFNHLADPLVEFELETTLLKALSENLRGLLRERVSEVLSGTSAGTTFDDLLEQVHQAIYGALMMRLLGEPDFMHLPFSLSQLGRSNSEWCDWDADPADGSGRPPIVN